MDWSNMHQCDFALDKFRVMGITRRRETNLVRWPATRPVEQKIIRLQWIKILVVATHKF